MFFPSLCDYVIDIDELQRTLEDIDTIRSQLHPKCHGEQYVSARRWCSFRPECCGGWCVHSNREARHPDSCKLAGFPCVGEPGLTLVCQAEPTRQHFQLASTAATLLASCIRRLSGAGGPADVRLESDLDAVVGAIAGLTEQLFPSPHKVLVCKERFEISLAGFTDTVRCSKPLAPRGSRRVLERVLARLTRAKRDVAAVTALVSIAGERFAPLAMPIGARLRPLVCGAPPAEPEAGEHLRVEQECFHDEPAAERDEDVLRLQADSDWAALVERRLHGAFASSTEVPSSDSSEAEAEAPPPEDVHILRFGGGDGERLRQALLEGPEFRPCREALERAGYSCVHPSRAVTLVRPHQYSDVDEALKDHDLHPFNVVIATSFEYLLEEILAAMPCRRRPRQKPGSRQVVVAAEAPPTTAAPSPTEEPPTAEVSSGEEEDELMLCVRRTFLCVAPVFRSQRTVAQSTTEAVRSASPGCETRAACMKMAVRAGGGVGGYYSHFRGVNPRRVVASW